MNEFSIYPYKYWYAVTYIIKKGGYASYTVYINANNAKQAREFFDSACYKKDSFKRSRGLNPPHRFQITVTRANPKDVDINKIVRAGETLC